ncbi:dehydrogenase [Fusarium heterosporum]|uniref:Dehydrogenase n=1 Tax=Fusarium heterosporum TaxID=42747 RepID=A0A8H5SUH6_FUSHE|nr:dehydrogenase [Fusarium heterosporum]
MAETGTVKLAEALAALPSVPASHLELRTQTQNTIRQSTSPAPLLVILDDDPTGTQTCHDVTILTVWDIQNLVSTFKQVGTGNGFFILTNSRALHPQQAKELMVEICTNLQAAARETNIPYEIVLRGDSILRGHFPLEPEAVEQVNGRFDAWVLCPFFLQGGRYTINDIHYVHEGENLIPAAETPFAKDATFGYKSSNLRDYVVEKSKGNIPHDKIFSIDLDTIRVGGPDGVFQKLMQLPKPDESPVVLVINAAADEDMDVVITALLQAAQQGKRFLYRTGAAFVSSRLGISSIPPLSAGQLGLSKDVGGLIIAGSYVPKTTAQLDSLVQKSGDNLTTITLNVKALLKSDQAAKEDVARAIEVASQKIKEGHDVLIMTSRELVVGRDEVESLDIGSTIALALVSFLQGLQQKPRYIIAKGGITSSDMATKGLRMKRALIVGQAAPGVPMWRCDEPESKWPGINYVVFPGNVGHSDSLFEVVRQWREFD